MTHMARFYFTNYLMCVCVSPKPHPFSEPLFIHSVITSIDINISEIQHLPLCTLHLLMFCIQVVTQALVTKLPGLTYTAAQSLKILISKSLLGSPVPLV